MAALIRVYADTSVYGGVLDDEFRLASRAFFNAVLRKEIMLVSSALVVQELTPAPVAVKEVYDSVFALADQVELGEEVDNLVEAYIHARVIGSGSRTDAMHVAAATIGGCTALVSWNLKHIVSMRRIPLFNGVNAVQGYHPIGIYTPLEVTGGGRG